MTTKGTQYINSYNKRRKLVMLKGFGGKCQICGYNKCNSALEFHHLNPDKKDITLSRSIYSWEKTKDELKKCICVCANCHREIHEGLIEVDSSKQYFNEELVEDYDPKEQNISTRFKNKYNWDKYDIVNMKDNEQKSFEEISKIVGCSVSYIRKKYNKIKKCSGHSIG